VLLLLPPLLLAPLFVPLLASQNKLALSVYPVEQARQVSLSLQDVQLSEQAVHTDVGYPS